MDLDKTLEELEGSDWGGPPFPSSVVESCHRIRKKTLRTLTDEDLRLAIGQDVGTGFLLPLAIQRLRSNPLISGDMYEGDLLNSVLRAACASPLTPDQEAALDYIVQRFAEIAPQLDSTWRDECSPAIEKSVQMYRASREARS
jgi:hypothetical protein